VIHTSQISNKSVDFGIRLAILDGRHVILAQVFGLEAFGIEDVAIMKEGHQKFPHWLQIKFVGFAVIDLKNFSKKVRAFTYEL